MRTYPRVYDDDGVTFTQTKTTYSFDSYGNPTVVYDWGTYPACCDNGDEFTTRNYYLGDNGDGVVNRLAQSIRYPGRTSSPPATGRLSQTETFYEPGTDRVSQVRVGIEFDDSDDPDPDRWSNTYYTYNSRGQVALELTRFGGHLILDVCRGEGGPDGLSVEVSRGVPA